MSDRVRLGVLGVSSHFELRVITSLLNSNIIEVYAIASRNIEKAEDAAEKWGIPVCYGSYEELLEDPEVDMIYNPLPNHLHAPMIKKAADAGKAMICEKPVALDSNEAREALDYARSKEVLIMEAFMYKFHPQWVRVKELVKCGEIGQVRLVDTIFTYNNTDKKNIRNMAGIGGGALMDIGCYAISVPRFIFDSEPLKVMAMTERDPEFKTDRISSAILEFEDARATFTVSTQLFGTQKVEIVGTGGRILVSLPFNMYPDVPGKVYVTNDLGTRLIECGPADQYGKEFEAFARAVKKGGPAPVDSRDAVYNMKVIDALFESEKTGTWAAT